MYDFEALLDAIKRLQATKDLLIENAQSGDVKVANKQNKVMFMSTPMFKFLGICN